MRKTVRKSSRKGKRIMKGKTIRKKISKGMRKMIGKRSRMRIRKWSRKNVSKGGGNGSGREGRKSGRGLG